MEERPPDTREVGGSIPPVPTLYAWIAQFLVERPVEARRVGGSIPPPGIYAPVG